MSERTLSSSTRRLCQAMVDLKTGDSKRLCSHQHWQPGTLKSNMHIAFVETGTGNRAELMAFAIAHFVPSHDDESSDE